jgi:hypothetical protein
MYSEYRPDPLITAQTIRKRTKLLPHGIATQYARMAVPELMSPCVVKGNPVDSKNNGGEHSADQGGSSCNGRVGEARKEVHASRFCPASGETSWRPNRQAVWPSE